MTDSKVSALLAEKKLMIFDFDGTLADTTPLHAAAFAEVLAPFGVSVNYASIAGRKTRDALSDRLSAAGVSVTAAQLDGMAAEKQRRVRELIRERLQPLPGVGHFLDWAQTRARLAIYSSGSRGTVRTSLERLGYAGRFDPVVCAEDVSVAKPDPEGFLKVLAITSVPQPQAVVFEDSDAGTAAARAAGLAVIDVRITSFEQLARSIT